MTSRLVAAAVVMAISAIAPPARAQPRSCAQTVAGDAHLAMAVRAHLSSAASCAGIRADVHSAADGVTVRLRDRDGRTAVRVVSSALVAAMWIESWTRRDLGASLLPAPAPTAAPPGADLGPIPPPVEQAPQVSFALTTRSVTGSNDVQSRAFGAGACVMVGPICAGLDAQLDQRGDLTANDGLTRARRTAVDALFSARLPVPIGRATFAPNLGLGLGYTRTARQEPSFDGQMPDGCVETPIGDPNQPPEPCAEPIYIGDGYRAGTLGVRIHGGLALAVPITGLVSLELSAGITLAPTAHRDPFDPYAGQTTDPSAPDGMTSPPSDPMYWLPGEALRSSYWGIGLRVGRP
ncbi:MAG TPA: hypothetical protein VML75_17670 [Kofleriaceae bacterium]|nr:hypothetical protein [Kofleriaceae bacterium]